MLEQLPRFYRAYSIDSPDDRGELVELFYLYMRAVDDVADCDQLGVTDSPEQREKADNFLAARRQDQTKSSNNYMSVIFDRCAELAESVNLDRAEFSSLCSQLLDSLDFDLHRRNDMAREAIVLSSQTEINQRSFNNFIDPTLGLMAKTVDSSITTDSEKFAKIHSLGKSSRRYYNLEDLVEDISRGLINVSREDAEKFGLDEDDFLSIYRKTTKDFDAPKKQKRLGVTNPEVREFIGENLYQWSQQQLVDGKNELDAWKKNSAINFMGSAAIDLACLHRQPLDTFMYFGYEMGANKFYRKN